MNAVIGSLNVRQESVLHGDHHIISAVSLADGLSGLKAGMVLYQGADGYKPLPVTYVTDGFTPVAVLIEDVDGPTSGTVANAAVHGAIRADKAQFANKGAATSALVTSLRSVGIYVIGAVAPAAQVPVLVADLAAVSAAVGEEVTLTFGVKVNDGGQLTYQWYRNSSASASGGTAVSGAVEANYKPDTSAAGSSYFYCVATNTLADSTATKTSAVCTLTVA